MACRYLADESATGLFLYPTKALSNDQRETLQELYEEHLGLDIAVFPYDGDRDQDVKQTARREANVIISNFAGINVYLHHHRQWARFFGNLDLVVVDESHTYTGVHGMHVAWILRRLKRLVDQYGADPQYVCTTATIGNPREHTEALIGEETTVVDDNGAPSGERNILFWNPVTQQPSEDSVVSLDDTDAGTYGGATAQRDAAALTAHLAVNDVQTLTFTRARKGAELGSKQAIRAKLDHPDADGEYISVEPYHAGLGKKTRYRTETQFQRGAIDAVVSTNALELGIDIGGVDAAVLTGYPGTRQSFWQQIGRAGRGENTALAALVARQEAIDQYVVNHPEYLLDDPVEDAVIDLSNNDVYAPHVLCAADEHPLTHADKEHLGGERLEAAVEMWRRAGKLTGDLDTGVIYDGPPRPQSNVDLYTSSDTQFTVVCDDPDVDIDHDTVGRERAYRDYHEGALFLHDGEQFRVTSLDEDRHQPRITVEPEYINEYTRAVGDTSISDLTVESQWGLRIPDHGESTPITLHIGTGTVSTHYTHFHQYEIETGNITDFGVPIHLPPLELDTQLLWLTYDERLVDKYLREWTYDAEPAAHDDLPACPVDDDKEVCYDHSSSTVAQLPAVRDYIVASGLHAAEHALIKTAPLELQLSKSDLGGLSTNLHPETGQATLFIYDGVEGGLGFSKRIADRLDDVSTRARERVGNCDCTGGCPACVMDSQCGSRNLGLFPVLGESMLGDLSAADHL